MGSGFFLVPAVRHWILLIKV
uniref:Uncharacterized protein n=1 Tax=Anguilla anguilla TaxID=7936 RepID=A0A0E9PU20_ANGAN